MYFNFSTVGIKKQSLTKNEKVYRYEDDVQKFGPRPGPNFQKCSDLMWSIFLISWFITPNMTKIGAFFTISKFLDSIILMIWKNAITNFWYFAKNKLIYQKSGPNNQAKAEHRALFSLELHISDAHCAAVFGPRPKLFD